MTAIERRKGNGLAPDPPIIFFTSSRRLVSDWLSSAVSHADIELRNGKYGEGPRRLHRDLDKANRNQADEISHPFSSDVFDKTEQ